jgi:membrane protein required for colicin V production
MIETELNIFDIIVVSIMFLSCLFAFFRGFVSEVLSLGAWIGAGLVTIYFFPTVAEKLEPHFKSEVVAAGVGTLGIYILALLGFSLFNRVINQFLKSGNDVGLLDNAMGLVFGAARGAFIVSIGYLLMMFVIGENETPNWLYQAKTRPYVKDGAAMIANAAPAYLQKISHLQKDKLFETQDAPNNNEETAYPAQSVNQLEGLFEDSNEEKTGE